MKLNKKALIALSLVLFAVLLFAACNDGAKRDTTVNAPTADNFGIGEIDTATAVKMIQDYNKYVKTTDSTKKLTNTIWVSAAYLHKLDSLARISNAGGVRVYLGMHNDSNAIDPAYKNYLSAFFVLTSSLPGDTTKASSSIQYDILKGDSRFGGIFSADGVGSVYNTVVICPPPVSACPGATLLQVADSL